MPDYVVVKEILAEAIYETETVRKTLMGGSVFQQSQGIVLRGVLTKLEDAMDQVCSCGGTEVTHDRV